MYVRTVRNVFLFHCITSFVLFLNFLLNSWTFVSHFYSKDTHKNTLTVALNLGTGALFVSFW